MESSKKSFILLKWGVFSSVVWRTGCWGSPTSPGAEWPTCCETLSMLKHEKCEDPVCLLLITWAKGTIQNVAGKWLHSLQVLQDSKIKNYLNPWELLAQTTLLVLKRKCEIKQLSQSCEQMNLFFWDSVLMIKGPLDTITDNKTKWGWGKHRFLKGDTEK